MNVLYLDIFLIFLIFYVLYIYVGFVFSFFNVCWLDYYVYRIMDKKNIRVFIVSIDYYEYFEIVSTILFFLSYTYFRCCIIFSM
jgi:hypothetical protein